MPPPCMTGLGGSRAYWTQPARLASGLQRARRRRGFREAFTRLAEGQGRSGRVEIETFSGECGTGSRGTGELEGGRERRYSAEVGLHVGTEWSLLEALQLSMMAFIVVNRAVKRLVANSVALPVEEKVTRFRKIL